MPVSFNRQDELDKMLSEFASFDHLENIEFPDDSANKDSDME